jgi:hypothetical protein
MNRIWFAAAGVVSVMAGVACSASDTASELSNGSPSANNREGSGGTSGGSMNAGTSPGGGSSSGTSGAEPTGETKGDPAKPGVPPQAGQLTAGVWDDNLNFDFYKKYLSLSTSLTGLPIFTDAERQAARDGWMQRAPATELDIAFVLDTTGSMGDELRYLQSEIGSIAATIQSKYGNMTARYGLVLYKDSTDEYLSRWFDFKPLAEFRTALEAQTVGGGGDYPEAVHEGLAQMNKLTWRAGAGISRVAFWVADAPHPVGAEGMVKTEILTAKGKDVHVYPVAASGTDARAEFTMRTAAQMTGGRYIFLTDDSGVGNAHAEPHIPCYYVTKFNDAIVRMVDSEISGVRVDAAPTQIVRTVGNPQNGTCVTKSQGNVSIY